jgi:hypothetical protein
MRRHSLGVFERAAGFEIGGQACGPECVTAELDFATDLGRPAPDHAVGVDPVHRVDGQRVGFAGRRAEEGPLGVAGDAGSGDVFVEEHFQLVMHRHLVLFAALFVQPHPGSFALGVIIFDPHSDDGADAGEGISHHTDHARSRSPTTVDVSRPASLGHLSHPRRDLLAPAGHTEQRDCP